MFPRISSIGGLVAKLCPTLVTRLLCPWDSPVKNTGVGCHFLLQRIFLTQEQNPCLPHCKQIAYEMNYNGSWLEHYYIKDYLNQPWWQQHISCQPKKKKKKKTILKVCCGCHSGYINLMSSTTIHPMAMSTNLAICSNPFHFHFLFTSITKHL